MHSVYVETSVIGYLASRPSANLITASNQRLTLDWWENHRLKFKLFVSQAVVQECSAGDRALAGSRLEYIKQAEVLNISEANRDLAKSLISGVPLPPRASIDALHIAVAAMSSVDFLLTWNCKHIANPALRRKIEQVLANENIAMPVICTPQEIIHV